MEDCPKYLITGQLGVNPELVELENNFPRFSLLIGEDESDISILKRVVRKSNELKNTTEKQNDKLNVAKETEGIVKPVSSHTNVCSDWPQRDIIIREKKKKNLRQILLRKLTKLYNLFSPILK